MKKSLLIILGFVLITITSCEYKYIEPLVIELPDEPVSFSQQIDPIFQDQCITCHASTSPILTSGNAYNSLINGNYINTTAPESSILYTQLDGSTGWHLAVSPTDLALILKWIQEGAENN